MPPDNPQRLTKALNSSQLFIGEIGLGKITTLPVVRQAIQTDGLPAGLTVEDCVELQFSKDFKTTHLGN